MGRHRRRRAGRTDDAIRWLEDALTVHRRVGARAWEAECHLELAEVGAAGSHADRAAQLGRELGLCWVLARLRAPHGARSPTPTGGPGAELSRDGEMWRVRFGSSSAHLRDSKGLADLHALLVRPGTDVHVLELAGAGHVERDAGTLLDPVARASYRHRLVELDSERAAARADSDIGNVERLDDERAALLAELRRATGLTGRPRSMGTSTTERARKTVTSRLREAIHRIDAVLPELGAHLDRSVVTGTLCRYEPTRQVVWQL